MKYSRFLAMISVSTVLMFGLMYLNTHETSHAYFSQTRAWMALLMGAAMSVVMLTFMLKMYPDMKLNVGIIIVSVTLFCLSLWLVRSQETVDDLSYLKAMIPHHSIAILTSERAHISDPRVRDLADEIIATQVREIAEMKELIKEFESRPVETPMAAVAAGGTTHKNRDEM